MKLRIVKPGATVLTMPGTVKVEINIAERAGRTCYASEPKGDPTAFIRKIIGMGHESVIEHISITAQIVCSRTCSHQLVRHRIASYSQQSQRYCGYSGEPLNVICPPSIGDLPAGEYRKHRDVWSRNGTVIVNLRRELVTFLNRCGNAFAGYEELVKDGIPKEDARFLLPNATATIVVTTFNVRQWRHVFRDRALNPKAQWEIKGIMRQLLTRFINIAPCLFDDLLLRKTNDTVPGRSEAADYAGDRSKHGEETGSRVGDCLSAGRRAVAASLGNATSEPACDGVGDKESSVDNVVAVSKPEVSAPVEAYIPDGFKPCAGSRIRAFDEGCMRWELGENRFRYREHAEIWANVLDGKEAQTMIGTNRRREGQTIFFGKATVIAVMSSPEDARKILPLLGIIV